jgi:nitrogen regulatory protein P-II 1
MKEIRAYIQPFMLQKVTDALRKIHVRGMSVSEMKGFGREKDESYPHHTGDYVVEFVPKVRIEIICGDDQAKTIIETIQNTAHTGRKGDGKIFVFEVLEATSILTGKKGSDAI